MPREHTKRCLPAAMLLDLYGEQRMRAVGTNPTTRRVSDAILAPGATPGTRSRGTALQGSVECWGCNVCHGCNGSCAGAADALPRRGGCSPALSTRLTMLASSGGRSHHPSQPAACPAQAGIIHMTVFRSMGRATALLFTTALILAACGGSTSSSAPSGSAAAATTRPAASTAVTPTDGPSADPLASLPIGAFPSFDLSQLATGLENVDLYRVAMTTNGAEVYKGVVVTKPVLSRDLMIGGTTRVVVIGNEAWTGEGDEPLKSVPPALATGLFAAFDPTVFVAAFAGPQWAQSSLDKGVEQKNGVNAHHYVINSTTLVGGFAGLPAGAAINVWIADEGYLVAWESTGLGTGDTSIQVTGIDDPANKVDRPS